MPIYLNQEERKILFEENNGPVPMLDLMATAGFRAADAGIRLGVFNVLAEGANTPATIAHQLNASERGIAILLDNLEVFGYVQQTGEENCYVNTPMTTRWLFPQSDTGYDYTVVHRFWSTLLFQLWDNLEETIKQGQPTVNFYAWLEEHPETRQDFQRLLQSVAQAVAPHVIENIALTPEPKRLLDVGGGHGLFSMAFCKAYEGLEATVFDFPGAVAVGQAQVDKAGLSDRVSCRAGNFMEDDWGEGYDVILLFSIVHGFMPADNVAMLKKAIQALNPGGHIIILEQLAGMKGERPSPFTDTFNRVFKLNLFHLLGAQTYTLEDIEGWLGDAGISNSTHILIEATQDSLIVAQKSK